MYGKYELAIAVSAQIEDDERDVIFKRIESEVDLYGDRLQIL